LIGKNRDETGQMEEQCKNGKDMDIIYPRMRRL